MRTVKATIYNRFLKIHEADPIFHGDIEVPENVTIDEVSRKIVEKWCAENGCRCGTVCFDNLDWNDSGNPTRHIVRFNFHKIQKI